MLRSNVASHSNHTDHSTSNQPSKFVVTDLGINSRLFLLFSSLNIFRLLIFLFRRGFSSLLLDLLVLRVLTSESLVVGFHPSTRYLDRSPRLELVSSRTELERKESSVLRRQSQILKSFDGSPCSLNFDIDTLLV